MERADRDRARQLPRLPDFASACASCLPLPASSPLRASHCSVFLLSPSPHPFDFFFIFFFLKEFVFVFHVNSRRLPSPRLGRGSPFHSQLPASALASPSSRPAPAFPRGGRGRYGHGGARQKAPSPHPCAVPTPGNGCIRRARAHGPVQPVPPALGRNHRLGVEKMLLFCSWVMAAASSDLGFPNRGGPIAPAACHTEGTACRAVPCRGGFLLPFSLLL